MKTLLAILSLVFSSSLVWGLDLDGSETTWTDIYGYPAACSAGAAVSTLADTPTCSSFVRLTETSSVTFIGEISARTVGSSMTIQGAGGLNVLFGITAGTNTTGGLSDTDGSIFFDGACTGNNFVQDISNTGALTCAAATGGGVATTSSPTWTGSHIFEASVTVRSVGRQVVISTDSSQDSWRMNVDGMVDRNRAYAASASRTTNQTIAINTLTDVIFTTELFDTASMFSATSTTMTVPTNGLYLVICQTDWAAGGDNTIRRAGITLNGDEQTRQDMTDPTETNIGAQSHIAGFIKANLNDRIGCNAYNTTGSVNVNRAFIHVFKISDFD